MKIKILVYPDGKITYATGTVTVAVNKEFPEEVQEVEVSEIMGMKLLNNPDKYKLEVDDNGEGVITEI